ncbi:ATP:cob(I)alamin adenosyltransferase [Undibacterium pigrum]|uniref:Cobalamin adenosyltransferase n=2 Tax=Undibacterium pigrum TaxID=401470 RepID=A0A318IT00_9BURK|nr:ATP:cob(I)alamin adenosyltransferase [Undibacterium pigrum]
MIVGWHTPMPYMLCLSKFCRILSHFLIYFLLILFAMGNRLSKIATRTGDKGTTGLGDGSRVAKDALRVHAMGDVDELNSQISVLLCEDMPEQMKQELFSIQHDLFDMGGELCIPGYTMITETQVERLDALLEKYNADLPPLKDFILPGGSRAAAIANVCRTVCRRAERAIVSVGNAEAINDAPRQYMNRLSDLLFVLSRVLNRYAGGSDVLWEKERQR